MKSLGLLIAALATSFAACRAPAKECAPETHSTVVDVVDAPELARDAAVDASADGLQVSRLAPDDLVSLDAAPGPDGTIFVAAIGGQSVGEKQKLYARLYQWDVASARMIAQRKIAYEHSEIWTGVPIALRLATSDAYAYVAAQLRHGSRLYLYAFEANDHPSASRTALPALRNEKYERTSTEEDGAVDVSIAAAAESWMAVTYRPGPQRPLELHLYSTPTKEWEEIGHKTLVTERGITGAAPHDIAFVDGKLYVVEQPSATETRVSELAVPSLKTNRSFSVHHEKNAPGDTQLVVRYARHWEGSSRFASRPRKAR